MATAPFFRGTAVRRISAETEGYALWLRSATGGERRYLVDEARALRNSLPESLARDEIDAALRLCERPHLGEPDHAGRGGAAA